MCGLWVGVGGAGDYGRVREREGSESVVFLGFENRYFLRKDCAEFGAFS